MLITGGVRQSVKLLGNAPLLSGEVLVEIETA
jgi:hypothetical protein